MQLSDLLTLLYDALPSVELAPAEHMPRLRDALRHAMLRAEGLEQAVRMLEARQMPSIHQDALVVGLSTGKVSILPVHRTLITHGFDEGPDLPDRRFGEDREMPF